jgi:hypothetical protein
MATQIARSAYASPQSVATSVTSNKPAQASGSDITDRATYDTKTTKPAPFTPGPSAVKFNPEPGKFTGSAEGPAPVAKPTASASSSTAEPEFKGRMISPSDSGVGATPPAATFVGSKKDMRQGGPMTEPLSSKDFARQPPSSMQECVQVGANKYRIV